MAAATNSSGVTEETANGSQASVTRCRSPPAASLEGLPLLEDRVHLEAAAKIGSGNLGVVLLAQDRSAPSRSLAVKILSLQLVRDTGHDEERIWQEVQVMRDLEPHPSLVRLVDVLACWDRLPHVQSDPPHVCIVTEYVADSEPLSSFLRRLGPSVQLAGQVLPQLADALAMLHRRGLVHRDVWCENVLICERTGHTVLVDFGCAEYLHSEAPVNTKLNIPYMSPEAARGQRQCTGDDCWALGLVLTEMLTGRFVADRLGRSDWPIHYSPHVLAETRQDAALRGGAWLGELCGRLLEPETSRRLSMAELSARWAREASRVVVAVVPSGGPPGARPVAWQGSGPLGPCLQPLQSQPRGYAPQLRVLRKKAASALVPPGTPMLGSTPPQPPHGDGACDTTAPLAGASGAVPPAAGAPMQRQRASGVVTSGTLVVRAGGRVSTAPHAVVMPVVTPCGVPSRPPTDGASVLVTTGMLKAAAGGDPSSQLSAGLRVTYLARSNGQRYLGYIAGRLASGSGWHVLLDVGEKKDVDDNDAWRIQPLAAA